jgi:spermidine synthase
MNRPALYLVVSLSGAAVLALEILGTRVLAPFYGASLYLWSALISVTLAALAAGYAVGGRWADRGPTAGRLAAVLVVAGAWVLAVPLLRAPLLHASEAFGLRAAVLVAATVLFFPPLVLLGMVGPYAIRLAIREVGEVGRTAGDLFAVSTLASVAAALLTGFVLIPELGVTRLLFVVAIALFVAALVAAGARRAGGPPALLLALAGLALGAWGLTRTATLPPGVLALEQSPYGELRVIEHKEFRYLLIDGGMHTIVQRDDNAPRQPYILAGETAALTFARPGRALLLGLGGGSMARVLARDGWEVDAVDIDPAIAKLAARFFRLDPGHASVTVADARRYLRETRESWSFMFFDVYASGSMPLHVATAEAFAEARRHLAPGGAIALNVEGIGWHDPLIHALAATLGSSFPHVVALPTSEPPNQLGNVVLVASDHELELDEDALGDPVGSLPDEYEHWCVLQRRHAWDNRFTPGHGRVLTDDWNPADLHAEEINLAVRRSIRRDLPAVLLGW